MMLKAILCVQHFCIFVCAKLFIVNLILKTDSTVICVPCMLEHVCYESFYLKMQIWKISYISWLNFVYCLKFTRL